MASSNRIIMSVNVIVMMVIGGVLANVGRYHSRNSAAKRRPAATEGCNGFRSPTFHFRRDF
jgi:hypothetical protein